MDRVRQTLRQLARSPGFLTVALLTLAAGVGACVAIFSLVRSIVLRPLPYPDSDALVLINETKLPQLPEFSVAPGQFFEWQRQTTTFQAMAAVRQAAYNMTGAAEPLRASVQQVSANLFELLQVSPSLGRAFSAGEDAPGMDRVLILDDGFWRRQFGARPDVLGQTVSLDGYPFRVIGVMPPSFRLAGAVDFYMPLAYGPADRQNHGAHVIDYVVGHLKPGVSVDQASSELGVIAQRLAQQFPATNQGWGVKVTPLLDAIVGDVSDLLFLLLGAVCFLLLIACANVANLLMARATGRSKEVALRAALGATPSQIFRHLLGESLALAALGSALGIALGYVGMNVLVALAPGEIPRAREIGIDTRVLAFTALLAVVTGVAFGLVPALRAARIDLNRTLKEGGRGTSEGSTRHRLRGALVIFEVALAFMLLVGAGLFVRSFGKLQTVSPGFDPDRALAVALPLTPSRYGTAAQQVLFAQHATQELGALPGVTAAAAAHILPLSGSRQVYAFEIAGRPPAQAQAMLVATYYAITPGYFDAMSIPLLRGRAFAAQDDDRGKPVVIVNDTIARTLFPGEEAVGKRIAIGYAPGVWREIVGVVGDVKHDNLGESASLQLYEPFAQHPADTLMVVLRSAGDNPTLPGAVRSAVHALDPDQPVTMPRPLREAVADATARERFSMYLFSVFSIMALFLASVGIYGVMSYSVTQRRAEIGIRMALGAHPGRVLRMILAQGGRLVALGLLIGLGGALLLTRALERQLFGLAEVEAPTLLAIAALLTLVSGVSCLIPALRATKVDPMTAFRTSP
ncbi:MAG TPA: ABC transporter permease [Polyangia bacterium]|nr:ABC transporter permease [Polyangia bacterium]